MRPSGLKASAETVAVWAFQPARSRPEAGSQSLIVWRSRVSSLPVARTLPSGAKAAAQASAVWPASASGASGGSSRQIRASCRRRGRASGCRGGRRDAGILSGPGRRAVVAPWRRPRPRTAGYPPGPVEIPMARSVSSGEKAIRR